jgi:large subunit ribosomal protein L18
VDNQRITTGQRTRRKWRVRRRVRGTPQRPRLSVFRSHRHVAAQIIDDEAGRTLAAASTRETLDGTVKFGGNKDAAAAVGRVVAQRALAQGIQQVAFDRRDYRYHGRVAALADAARKAGLQF